MNEEHIEKHLNRPNRKFEFHDKVTYIEHQEITVQDGATFYNGPAPETPFGKVVKENSEVEELGMVFDELIEERDENGKNIFSDQAQWYAVYRVLNEKLNYPKKMTDFQRTMQKMGFDNLAVPCVYTSLKKGSQQCPALSSKVDTWEQYRRLSECYEKQYLVADFLLKKLGFKI